MADETDTPAITPDPAPGPRTLAIDIGGTGLKASVLDSVGAMVVPRAWTATPDPCPPAGLIAALRELVRALPAFDRVSVGFPGMVRDGVVLTAPHFQGPAWAGFALAEALQHAFDRPVRLLNDAEIQGYGVISGQGLEFVLTLGTGAGSALFKDGALAPHLELAQHPCHKKHTYNDYVGKAALHRIGRKRWNRRVLRVIGLLDTLTKYDRLYIGGGNAPDITVALPDRTTLVSNNAGITGGIALWRD